MTPRQVRHGLAVLQQHNLLFYHTDPGAEFASYEANPDNAYNLVRTGKILEMIDTSFGAPAKDVMQSLLLSGQTRVSDLVAAYKEKLEQGNQTESAVGDDNDFGVEANGANGDSKPDKKAGPLVKSTAHLNTIICRLVEAELIDVVHTKTFESSEDILKTVEKEVMQKHFPTGVKGNKAKVELQERIAEGLRKVRGESKSLKRKLEQNGSAAKRRKLLAGLGMANGDHDEDMDPALDVSGAVFPLRFRVEMLTFIALAKTSHQNQLREVPGRSTQSSACPVRKRHDRRDYSICVWCPAEAAYQGPAPLSCGSCHGCRRQG